MPIVMSSHHSDDRRITLTAPGLWAMVAIHGGALLALLPQARPTVGVLWLAFATFAVRNFCISAGYHRYFAHGAFRTSRLLQFLLAFVGGMGVMRSALWWAAHHRAHHRSADRPGDPHSPRDGWWWSHWLWFMAKGNQPTRRELVKDWARFPELLFLDRHEWLPIVTLVGITWWIGGLAGWVWAANVSSVVLCHVTFALNSVTHRLGRRRHDLADDSTNLWPVALLTFGEGWHNNHHHQPHRARLGHRAAEIDISWYGILVLEKLRLVHGVQR
jgi:stearoyl-CoA desaturase (delta-9 desaturase)